MFKEIFGRFLGNGSIPTASPDRARGIPTPEERVAASFRPQGVTEGAREAELAEWAGNATAAPSAEAAPAPIAAVASQETSPATAPAQELPSDPFSAPPAPVDGTWSGDSTREQAGNDSLAA